MLSPLRQARRLLGVAACAVLVSLHPVSAQGSKSASVAQELASLLTAGNLDAIAAQHPSEPDRFVAALYFPGTLLVVSARYSVPQLLTARLEMREYRDVYVELNGASMPESKVFVQDVGANGLVSDRDGADSFERAGTNAVFNREWREQNIASEEEYEKRYADADAEYATILAALVRQAQQ